MAQAGGVVVLTMTMQAKATDPVQLYAAGSLRSALTEIAAAFEAQTHVKVQAKFGPSGTLKDEIAADARADVRKALKLVGGPDAPTAPAGRNVYGMLIADGKADLFLTYCINAMEAKKDVAGAQIVALPDELAVGADYGLTVIANAAPDAYRFAMSILSGDAQRVLAKYGFSAPTLPQ